MACHVVHSMTKTNEHSLPTIEFMPNELFIELFQYFDHTELCQSWTGLNTRIECLLDSTRSKRYIIPEDFELQLQTLVKWGNTIHSLQDHRGCATYENVYIPLNFKLMVNLRRLRLRCWHSTYFSEISQSNLPNLEVLEFVDNREICLYENFLKFLFGKDCLSSLKSIGRLLINENLPAISTKNMNIHHLALKANILNHSFASIVRFIEFFPNLTSLEIWVHFFQDVPLDKAPCHIRRLALYCESQTDLDQVEYLLDCNPVERLRLELGRELFYSSRVSPCDFVRLAHILDKCRTLRHVQFRCWYCICGANIEEIRKLTPWFASLHIVRFRNEHFVVQTKRF